MSTSTRRDSRVGEPHVGRSFATLTVIQILIGMEAVAYSVWPPVPTSPIAGDRTLAVLMFALAAFSYFAAPRLARWALDLSLGATWLALAALTASRETAQGQIILGLAMLVLAVYIAYFLPPRRAFVHVALLVGAYGVALTLNPQITGPFFGLIVVLTVLSGALIIGRLRESDRKYRLLVDNAADVVYHTRDGIVQWISPSVTDVLGWAPEDLIGKSTRDKWHPDDRDAAFALRDEAYDGKIGIGVFRFQSMDGHYVWIEITLRPYKDPTGLGGAVGSMRDVSARVEAEQALVASEQQYRLLAEMEAQHSQRLEALDEAKSRLFQNISHELRTPLAVIHGPLESLSRSPRLDLTLGERRELEAALRASERLHRLVDGLPDVARGEAGQLVNDPQPTDLPELTEATVAMFRSAAERAGLELTVNAAHFPGVVAVDRELWLKILFNLLSNALKFTEAGRVVVELRYDSGAAELRVADTGVGIPSEDLSRIFDRFHQSSSGPLRGDSGTGIGLALVAEVVKAVGGTVRAESTPGLGTAFTVRVPAPMTDEAVAEPKVAGALPTQSEIDRLFASVAQPSVESASQASVPDPELSGRSSILLVEDNADLRAFVARLLRDEGWSVTARADAESAQEVVADHDLLLCDVMLPGIDGIELVRQVRAREDNARWMPVILLTARAGNESLVNGLSSGADDYITKPFTADELIARVRTHMELAMLRRVVLEEAGDRADNLKKALGSNRVIGTAVGILMTSDKITAEEAFGRLRATSQHSNRKLRDVADEVVFTGALPSRS